MTVKKKPMRKCVGCGEMKPKNELIRIVKTPEDNILIDKTGKLNGRGAYICPCDDCLLKAVKSKRIDRSFGICIDESIYQNLKEELSRNDK